MNPPARARRAAAMPAPGLAWATEQDPGPARVVLDTHIVLDLWVFQDPLCAPLRARLQAGPLRWLATAAMREELARVLHYPAIARRREALGLGAEAVLACFDRHAQRVPAAARAPLVCQDPDDQVFIDLAVAHQARLISKDRAVRALDRRLAALGVQVLPHWTPP